MTVRRAKQLKRSQRNSQRQQPRYQDKPIQSKRDIYNKVLWFSPLNEVQDRYIEQLKTNTIILATGDPGTGKSLCPIAYALSQLYNGNIDTIYLCKPIIEVGSSLGYLPGTIEGKYAPYMSSLLDHMYTLLPETEVNSLMRTNKIKCVPLQYMRGTNFDNCIIIADEMQNATLNQIRTLLTRIKEDTTLILTGDLDQCDLPNRLDSGLSETIRIISDIDKVAMTTFNTGDIVRSGIVRDITMAFKRNGY